MWESTGSWRLLLIQNHIALGKKFNWAHDWVKFYQWCSWCLSSYSSACPFHQLMMLIYLKTYLEMSMSSHLFYWCIISLPTFLDAFIRKTTFFEAAIVPRSNQPWMSSPYDCLSYFSLSTVFLHVFSQLALRSFSRPAPLSQRTLINSN